MSEFFKIVEIEGKGLGCIALQDIKFGTLIAREEPMLRLPMVGPSGRDEILKVAPFISKFNHSCRPNASLADFHEDNIIVARSSIKAGSEITYSYTSYGRDPQFFMKNLKFRQEYLLKTFAFNCCCDLCKEEGDHEDGTSEKFEKLQKELKVIEGLREVEGPQDLEFIPKYFGILEREILCFKEMYKLAKERKAVREFIDKEILEGGFLTAAEGYRLATGLTDDCDYGSICPKYMEKFKKDGENFSRVAIQILKFIVKNFEKLLRVRQQTVPRLEQWKQRYNFETYVHAKVEVSDINGSKTYKIFIE